MNISILKSKKESEDWVKQGNSVEVLVCYTAVLSVVTQGLS